MLQINLNCEWSFQDPNKLESFVVELPKDFLADPDVPPEPDTSAPLPPGGHMSRDLHFKDLLMLTHSKIVLLDIGGDYINAELSLDQAFLKIHPNRQMSLPGSFTPALPCREPLRRPAPENGNSQAAEAPPYCGCISLWVGREIHICPWDLQLTAPTVTKEEAMVAVSATITGNGTETAVTVTCALIDPNGVEVAFDAQETMLTDKRSLRFELPILAPMLWDLDTPQLYRCTVSVIKDQTVMDTASDTFGIRGISAHQAQGLLLNGRPMALKDICPQNGLFCASAEDLERGISFLKQAGYNALRLCPSLVSKELLQYCDQLGMLVIHEDEQRETAPETQNPGGTANAIKRCDLNHPCIIVNSLVNT